MRWRGSRAGIWNSAYGDAGLIRLGSTNFPVLQELGGVNLRWDTATGDVKGLIIISPWSHNDGEGLCMRVHPLTKAGYDNNQAGGIVEKENFIDISNLALIDSKEKEKKSEIKK